MHIFTHALAPYSLLYHSTISQVSRSHINARRVIPFHLIPTFLHTPYCSHCLKGIKPLTLVNSLPGQVEAMTLHPINTLSGPVRVTPRKSEEGIEPFILVNSLPGQVGAMSSHLINPPSGL